MPDTRTQALRGHAAMLLFSVLVAGSFSLGSIAAPLISPTALNSVRFLIAASIIGVLVQLGPGLRREYLHAPWRYLLLGGLFSIYFVTMFEGLKTAAPVSTSAVFTLTPVMSAGFGYVLLRQLTTPRMAFALLMAAIGAIWVIFRGDVDAILAFNVGKGEMIFFVGCVAHAAYTPLVRKLNRGEPALVFTFGTLVAGFIVISVVGAKDIGQTDWTALPAVVWLTILYVSIFASATTFFLLQYAALRLPSAKVMAYTYLVPAWVIAWEAFLGNGLVGITVLAGVSLTIIALLMLLKD